MKSRFLFIILALSLTFSTFAKDAKYVFLFIGDGMGLGHVMAADTYYRKVLGNPDNLLMMQFPVASVATTYSANNTITDSAAAGTAISTSTKTNNGMIGVAPDSVPVYSIAKKFKDNGYGVAIGTTVSPDDATPSVFYAHQPSRNMYYEIGKDFATSNIDFLAGADFRGTKDKNGNPTDLYDVIKQNGYTIVRGMDNVGLMDNAEKIVFLGDEGINPNEVGFTIDSVFNALTLPYITQRALGHLQKVSPQGFFMMMEGGNIDHAAHANDGGTVIKEILNFNEAIDEAYFFYLQHPDETLIVVTADHDTGGMTLGRHGAKNPRAQYIDFQKMSKEVFADFCMAIIKGKQKITWPEMKNILTENFGLYKQVPVTKDQDEELQEEFKNAFIDGDTDNVKTLYKTFSKFNVVVFDILNKANGFGWTTSSHSGNMVPVFAVGVGAEQFSNLNDNTDLGKKILQVTSLK